MSGHCQASPSDICMVCGAVVSPAVIKYWQGFLQEELYFHRGQGLRGM